MQGCSFATRRAAGATRLTPRLSLITKHKSPKLWETLWEHLLLTIYSQTQEHPNESCRDEGGSYPWAEAWGKCPHMRARLKNQRQKHKEHLTGESVIQFVSNGVIYLVSKQGEVRKPSPRLCVFNWSLSAILKNT